MFGVLSGWALTLHLPLGQWVLRHEELHDGHQLDLQPQPKDSVHHDVVGGRPEDGETGCRTEAWSGRRHHTSHPSTKEPLAPPSPDSGKPRPILGTHRPHGAGPPVAH